MINVIVTYTVPENFVEQNITNISTFLEDFKLLDQTKFSYRILQKNDGKTFVHISKYENEEIQKQLLNVPSFLEFQKQRDESCDDIQQTIEILTQTGTSGRY